MILLPSHSPSVKSLFKFIEISLSVIPIDKKEPKPSQAMGGATRDPRRGAIPGGIPKILSIICTNV
jgi:hypothetical protein